MAAKYIMKCDDDTFVRVDSMIKEAKKYGDKSMYIGNMNYYHKPLRDGKWAVTYEVRVFRSVLSKSQGFIYVLYQVWLLRSLFFIFNKCCMECWNQ